MNKDLDIKYVKILNRLEAARPDDKLMEKVIFVLVTVTAGEARGLKKLIPSVE